MGGGRAGSAGQGVVPIVEGRPQASHGGVTLHQRLSHSVSSGIGVKAAQDRLTLFDQGGEPAGIGSSAGSRDTLGLGVDGEAADGVDGGLAENDGCEAVLADREAAPVLLRARRHAAPTAGCGAAQFGPDGVALLITKHEYGIGPVIGIKLAGGDEAVNESGRDAAVAVEVALHAPELTWHRWREL